jgi:flavin reductase (DIM6/NTAB) family NADH-FMN oxidoreductase RutF
MRNETDQDQIFYEPAAGHGLAHDPMNAIVAPRPIGWVATRGRNGSVNLAPYSFFNLFNYRPPIVGFCSIGAKDSVRNVRETGEFVWNLAVRPLAERMNATSATAPYGVSEFELAELTPVPARLVAVPRVAESPVNFECKVTEILQLTDQRRSPLQSWLVLGEVVGVHIRKALLKEGVFDTFGAQIIVRAGGPSAYAEIRPDTRFDMVRPP